MVVFLCDEFNDAHGSAHFLADLVEVQSFAGGCDVGGLDVRFLELPRREGVLDVAHGLNLVAGLLAECLQELVELGKQDLIFEYAFPRALEPGLLRSLHAFGGAVDALAYRISASLGHGFNHPFKAVIFTFP